MKDFRFELKPEYQEELFTKLLDQYGIEYLTKEFKVNHSVIYHYRNNRIRSIPPHRLDLILHILQPSLKEVLNNIVFLYDADVVLRKNLNLGRAIRKENLLNLKKDLPFVKNLIYSGKIDFEQWFMKYVKLFSNGAREIKSINIRDNFLVVHYSNYSKGIKKDFWNAFPQKFIMDIDFQYFLGLWTGDRVGKGRFGVCNKNEIINIETAKLLRRFGQHPHFDLHIHKDIPLPKLSFNLDKIRIKSSPKDPKGYAILVYSQNSTLFQFFDYLISDLDTLLSLLPNKSIFFAGLFDAEGNVKMEDGCVRWACMNQSQIEIYKKHLLSLGLFERYDGSCLISSNLDNFDKLIFPYLRHPDKINNFHLIRGRKGVLPLRFRNILSEIEKSPGILKKDLAKALNRVKLSSQVKLLQNLGYITIKAYPHMIYLTEKGKKELNMEAREKLL